MHFDRLLTRCRALCALGATILALGAMSSSARANVYPTALGQSVNTFNPSDFQDVTLSYILNENATTVTIDIFDASSNVVRTLNGGLTQGYQSVVWDGRDSSSNILPDGNYSFRVNTAGEAKSAWTLITTTDSELNNFYLPRGVAVNTNASSPYYGRVYVAEGGGTATLPPLTMAGRTVEDGVYMLNADLSDTGITTGVHTGNIPWITTSQSSPYKVTVGPDDSVYVIDWADAHAGIWQAPGDLSGTWVEVFDSTGRATNGLNATNGSISDAFVEGLGPDRKIYTIDEDFVPAGGSTLSVHQYDIGTDGTFFGPPSSFAYLDGTGATPLDSYNPTGNYVQNSQNGLARDNDGNIWISQFRSVVPGGQDLVSSLMRVNATTGEIDWSSVMEISGGVAANDPLRGTMGIAFDPFTGLLAVATYQSGGIIQLFDTVSLTVIDSFAFGGGEPGNTNNTDVAFDAAGNLYVSNRSAERVRVWSPPNLEGTPYRSNSAYTDSLAPLGALTISSASVGLTGDYNEDGKVDAADYVVWRKTNINGAQGYTDWRTNFGTSNGGSGGAVPEPGTLVLCMMVGLVGFGSCRRRG